MLEEGPTIFSSYYRSTKIHVMYLSLSCVPIFGKSRMCSTRSKTEKAPADWGSIKKKVYGETFSVCTRKMILRCGDVSLGSAQQKRRVKSHLEQNRSHLAALSSSNAPPFYRDLTLQDVWTLDHRLQPLAQNGVISRGFHRTLNAAVNPPLRSNSDTAGGIWLLFVRVNSERSHV